MRNRFAALGAPELEQIVALENRILELIIGIATRKKFRKFELIAFYRDVTNASYPEGMQYIQTLMGRTLDVRGEVEAEESLAAGSLGAGTPNTQPSFSYRPDMEETPASAYVEMPEIITYPAAPAQPNIRNRAPSPGVRRLPTLEDEIRNLCARMESTENRLVDHQQLLRTILENMEMVDEGQEEPETTEAPSDQHHVTIPITGSGGGGGAGGGRGFFGVPTPPPVLTEFRSEPSVYSVPEEELYHPQTRAEIAEDSSRILQVEIDRELLAIYEAGRERTANVAIEVAGPSPSTNPVPETEESRRLRTWRQIFNRNNST